MFLHYHTRYPSAPSTFTARIHDAHAMYVGEGTLLPYADGVHDDAPVLQRAIDMVQRRHGFGIVFIPQGLYAIKSTVSIWRGIRLIGYGERRPIFVLPADTPGFQERDADGRGRYLFHFKDEVGSADAKNTTFYSGLYNANIVIEDGNPAAVGVRFNVAQLSSLSSMDVYTGEGLASVQQIGNQMENCRLFGGEFGIITDRTSAGWQFLLMDVLCEGQRQAAIATKEAGMTLVRVHFRDVPHAVAVKPDTPRHGDFFQRSVEELYARDVLLENVHDAAFLISHWEHPANHVNLDNVSASNTPVLLAFRDKDAVVSSPAPTCRIVSLSHGLHIEHAGEVTASRENKTCANIVPLDALPPLPARDIPALPPQDAWFDVTQAGAVGDGATDDTAALQRAIATHRVVYLPSGVYRVRDTLKLRRDSVLVGLHCRSTLIQLEDGTPGFDDIDAPRAVIETAPGGDTTFTGLGVDAGRNPGAVAIRWRAGEPSYLADVWFAWGGHGDAVKGQDQGYSLWITEGGGGIFKNLWSANRLARNGLYISDTETPGTIYLMSVEHHLTHEVRLSDIAHWAFYALQTEENLGSERALAITMDQCRDVSFANLFIYRIGGIQTPHPHALHLRQCNDITLRGVHNFSWGQHPFTASVFVEENNVTIPEHEFAYLRV